MFLKRIELRGFKSFAGAKDILLGPGVTGIVGPNGSGKSNICDAIRWVLGEQSSRVLRGQNLQDVIFKGTQSRSKRNSCEVSLVFDNADAGLDVPYTEVAVTRRVNRAGESSFAINGTDCRLKDIAALFQGTGVGRDGYSIIGQGQISNILENRAAERRGVFEEAAGITGFRAAKDEAERNLSRARANAERIGDVLHELEDQLEPMREQMEKAKQYVALEDERRRLEVSMLLYDTERSAERRETLRGKLQDLSEQAADIRTQLTDTDQASEDLTEQLEQIRAISLELLNQIGQSGRESERQLGLAALEKQKTEAAEQQIRKLTQELEERRASRAGHASALEEAELELAGFQAQHAALRTELGTMENEQRESLHTGSQSLPNVEALRRKADNAEHEARELRVAEQGFKVRLQAAEQAESDARRRRLDADAALRDVRRRLAPAEAEDEEQRAREETASRDLDISAANLRQTGHLQEETARALAEARARLDVLRKAQEQHEGYYDGVRSLMRDVQRDRALEPHVLGVVAESISVDSELVTAVEIALGAAMQNVIVPADSDARFLVSYLRRHGYGRVTFLPANALRVRYMNNEERRTLREDGCICAANEAVECDPIVQPAIDYLLARTAIVRDLDAALRLKASGRNSFRIVTLQGDVVAPGGAITGGSTGRGQKNLLGRTRLVEDEQKHVDDLERSKRDLAELRSRQEAENRRADAVFQQQRSLGYDVHRRLNDIRMEYAAAEQNFVRMAASEQNCIKAAAQCRQDEADARTRAENAERSYAGLLELLRGAIQELESQRSAQTEAVLANAELNTKIADKRAEIADAEGRIRVCEARIETLRTSITHEDTALAALQQQIENAATQQAAAEHRAEKIQAQVDHAEDSVQELRARSEEAEQKEQSMAQELRTLADRKNALSDRERDIEAQTVRAEAEIARLEQSEESASERLWTEFELTLDNARKLRVEGFARQRAKDRVAAIRQELREMGPVNPQASDDYTRVQNRTVGLTTQLGDLQRAATDLQAVISDLLERMQSIFLEKFASINENFGRIFRELFGGGNAHIELTDGEQIMSSGIEILAEPPGKKLQSLSLLSGGERTLTAIALCLAMLAVNPSPVCILDEIDAPLDDKNAMRLADYLHRMSEKLQFIIITHRKTTMAVCDALYGVSMPDRGVSDIISVKLQ